MIEVTVGREARSLLAADEKALESADAKTTRLLGPFDLFLRPETGQPWSLTPPTPNSCGRCWVAPAPSWSTVNSSAPGAPAKSGNTFTVAVQPWHKLSEATLKAVTEQAEHLAAYRAVSLTGLDFAS